MKLIYPLVSNSQLTAQLVRTAHGTEHARYVRLELINLSGVSHRAFLVVKTKQLSQMELLKKCTVLVSL